MNAPSERRLVFTVAQLGDVNKAELDNTVALATAIQPCFRFRRSSATIAIDKTRYRLMNGALDLDRAVRDFMGEKGGQDTLPRGNLILVTAEPYSDETLATEFQGRRLEDELSQCYFYDEGLAGLERAAIASTFIWDRLPPRPDLHAILAPTPSGRRALQPYLLYTFGVVALNRLIDMGHHEEIRGCPFDYCSNVREIDHFWATGLLCREHDQHLENAARQRRVSEEQIRAAKALFTRAGGGKKRSRTPDRSAGYPELLAMPRELQPVDRPRVGVGLQRYDIFLSHASEDKVDIARPLYEALTARGVTVWFDEAALELGDSLRRKIDEGLRISRFGLVVLSPHFFAKPWPQRELDGLVARETASGEKAIIPLWHRLERDDVLQRSATLADLVAAKSSEGLPAVVEKILRVLHR